MEKITPRTPNALIDQFLEVDGWYETARTNRTIRELGFTKFCRAIRKAAQDGTLLWSRTTLHTPEFHISKPASRPEAL